MLQAFASNTHTQRGRTTGCHARPYPAGAGAGAGRDGTGRGGGEEGEMSNPRKTAIVF